MIQDGFRESGHVVSGIRFASKIQIVGRMFGKLVHERNERGNIVGSSLSVVGVVIIFHVTKRKSHLHVDISEATLLKR